jgi:hypothetical protein
MGNVVGSGVLSSLGTTGTTQLTDKVDSPHGGLFKAIHAMTQGNLALDFGGTDAHGTFGFSHTYSYSSGTPQVVVQGGVILNEGGKVAVTDSGTLTLTKPSSGAFYHWILVANGATIPSVVLGTADGVVPDFTAQATPISLIKVQSTDSGDLATQFFTTTKQSNSVSIGYDNSAEYAEMGSLTASATGLTIAGTTATIVTTPFMSLGNGATNAGELRFLEDTDNGILYSGFKAPAQVTGNSVYTLPAAYPASNKILQSTDAGILSWETAATSSVGLTGSTDNTIVTVTGANALAGEANLTFDATTLAVTGKQTITPANDVGGAALTITNQDVDQIALDIDASNTTGDVVDITANALTTAKVVDISATGLTDGMLLNAATTSTVTDGGTSTLVSTAMTNDGVGSQTAKGILLDYNKTGITASGKTTNLTGMQIDIDDSVTNVGTVNITGLDIDVDFGNAGGTVKTVGLDVAVGAGGTAADTAYSALFSGGNVGIGTATPTDPLHILSGGSGDHLLIEGTLASAATSAPNLVLFRDADSAAADIDDNDLIGQIIFRGENDGASNSNVPQEVNYATIEAGMDDTTDGSEDGHMTFNLIEAGTLSEYIRLRAGIRDVVINDQHDDIDFRVEGDTDEQLFFCDASADKIGISTSAPMNILQVNVTGADGLDGIQIVRDDATTADGEILGGIGFDSVDGNVPSTITEASAFIASYATEDHTATDKGGNLKFGVSLIDEDDDVVSTILANVGPPDTTANATCHAGFNSRATTAIVAAATYAPTVTDSGTLVIFEHANSNLTLPSINDAVSVGVQFTVFNETGSAINAQIAVSDSATVNGDAIADQDDIASFKAATFVCSGNNTWIRIG